MKRRDNEEHYLDDLCLCGHTWEDHFVNAKNGQIWCGTEDNVNFLLHCKCKNFTLDNLKHIEILAEDRGLI